MTGVLCATLAVAIVGGWSLYGLLGSPWGGLSDSDAATMIADRIVQAESNGCATLRNKRSTATGAAQFLDETWLGLIRAHRPELARRSEKDVLDMRFDPALSREITARLALRNAQVLRKRGFSVTPGTLYLSHFAGSAGAVAILSAPATADAAAIMASADATGRSTRDKIVAANPFLQRFTTADLKSWADRKMERQQRDQGCKRAVNKEGARLARHGG